MEPPNTLEDIEKIPQLSHSLTGDILATLARIFAANT
jgi:hypothetical protein